MVLAVDKGEHYNIKGATNYLCSDPEKINVRSPGSVALPVTIEDLKDFKASWHSRGSPRT